MKTTTLFFAIMFIFGHSYSQTVTEAIKKTNNERYPEAIRDFKLIVSQMPNDGIAYYYFGDCYFKIGLLS